MVTFQILLLGILLLVVPVIVGTLFGYRDKENGGLLLTWVSGQMLLWAGFQAISVPMILLRKDFLLVKNLFLMYMGLLIILAIILWLFRRRKGSRILHVVNGEETKKVTYVLWTVFGALLVFQLVQAGLLAYEEGDDAFYVAISTITESSNTMYQHLPYTGQATTLDARHALAPFPVWIAFLANVTGMATVTVAHVALPVVLILMAYAIYYLIGKHLLGKRREMMPLFMILVAILIIYGGYSIYSAENFLLVRTAQGKAVMANIIIPFLFLLALMMLEKIQKEEKIGFKHWFLLELTMITGCLCTTLGTVLTCMLLGIVGVCTAVCYRKWKILFPMFFCCVIPVGFAVLYLMLG